MYFNYINLIFVCKFILSQFSDRVNHKAIITKPPQNQTVLVGASVSLSCTVLSDLHRHIQWVFEGRCDNCPGSNKTNLKVTV